MTFSVKKDCVRSYSAASSTKMFIPLLLFGLEVCPLTKTDLTSLDVVVNRFFMKLFKASDINIV